MLSLCITVMCTVLFGWPTTLFAPFSLIECSCVLQLLHVVVEDLPSMEVSLIPTVDYSCMQVGFSTLHCGGYQGKSNGDIMVTCV